MPPEHAGADQTLQLVVDSIRDYAIFRLDVDGRVASWNLGAQLIKGYAPEEIIGESIARFYTDEDRGAGRPARLLGIARELGRVEDEGWRVRKDGSRFWADVVITPYHDGDGRHLGFSKITRDLTERRKWESDRLQLVQANEALRLRDEFLSIAAHELRTPLMAMQLQLDLALEHGTDLDAKTRGRIERANRNAQRLSALSSALLDVGRIAVGKLTLSPASADVSAIVRDVIERLVEPAHVARCEVIPAIQPDVRGVVDALRVAQVVSNLLANAFKYAAGTCVEVELRATEARAHLRVRDHGPGIAIEDRQRIFARFERASPRSLGGLGLGLYVVHQIVAAHGGSIAVREPTGGGAEFAVDLPLASSAPVVVS